MKLIVLHIWKSWRIIIHVFHWYLIPIVILGRSRYKYTNHIPLTPEGKDQGRKFPRKVWKPYRIKFLCFTLQIMWSHLTEVGEIYPYMYDPEKDQSWKQRIKELENTGYFA